MLQEIQVRGGGGGLKNDPIRWGCVDFSGITQWRIGAQETRGLQPQSQPQGTRTPDWPAQPATKPRAGEILARYRKSQTSWRDLARTLDENRETHKHQGKILAILVRWRVSRRDLAEI